MGTEQGATTHSLAELTNVAGVSVRTVRYYIAEGLLPPPDGAGSKAVYRQGHLDRLLLIGHWKAHYLPLKEIRRALAGLSDQDVARALKDAEASASMSSDHMFAPIYPVEESASPGVDDERLPDYLVEGWVSDSRIAPVPFSLEESAPLMSMEPAPVPEPDSAADYLTRVTGRQPAPAPSPVPPHLPHLVPYPKPKPPDPDDLLANAQPSRRIRITDGIELIVDEAAFQRHTERLEWLLRWARNVFGS